MSYIFGKLWHLAIIWAIRKAFQCILQGFRFLLANHTRISPTSENDSYTSYIFIPKIGRPTIRTWALQKCSRPRPNWCFEWWYLKIVCESFIQCKIKWLLNEWLILLPNVIKKMFICRRWDYYACVHLRLNNRTDFTAVGPKHGWQGVKGVNEVNEVNGVKGGKLE